ncbi:AAA family ATPase [Jiangella sp. DSM 45060]|uniref:AAA family ATPase n=1 Tax=Jiangella sp. DSM 45060 TaxID=1798224 RepID=UPI000B855AFE|nr:AAA family ATPase [Jiangella sp. DSM 45060]
MGVAAISDHWGSPVLVGRDAELARVRAAVTAPPARVVVAGESGIGKSRLVRELIRSDLGGRRVLVGHCEHLREPFPLGPLLGAVRAHGAALDPRTLSPVVGALAPLVPEIADRLPAPPPPLDDQRAVMHRVFRAATELLDRLGPAVLVVEDAHWADAGTLDFLTFLAAHQPPRLSVVVTARTEAGPPPLGEAFARAPSGPALSVELTPLGVDDVGELARRILGTDVPARTAAALADKTGGIPFVVEEVLRTLLEREPADAVARRADALSGLAVPTALRDVVRERLAALDPAATEVLAVAAVDGLTVDPRLISEVIGRDDAQVVAALAAAESAGLLHEHDGQSRFRHVLAQQIVYESLPVATRRWLHRSVAEAVERRGDPLPLGRVAHHRQHAGDTAAFVHYAELAADQAVSHGDDALAARFLLDATAVDAPLEVRLRLAAKLGRAAVDGLAHTEAVPILERLLQTPGLPPGSRGELRFALGRALRQAGRARDGYLEIERAVEDLGDRPALLTRALAVLAAPETVVGRHLREHTARYEQAERAAERSGRPEVRLAARITQVSLLLEQGDPAGWTLVDEFRTDDLLVAHPREHARACVNWAQAALHTGHVRRAGSLLAEGRRVAARAEYVRVTEVIELVAVSVDHAAGSWDGLAGRARALAATRFGAAALDGELLHATLLAASGETAAAAERLRELIATTERLGAVWPLVPARSALSRLLLGLDDVDGAMEQATAGLELALAKGHWIWAAPAVACLVDAHAAAGTAERAAEWVDALAAELGDVDAPLASAALRGCQAVLARAAGDAARADALQSAARTTLAAAGLRYEELRATERLGEWRCEAPGRTGGEKPGGTGGERSSGAGGKEPGRQSGEPSRPSGEEPHGAGGQEPGRHGGVESGDAGSRVTGDAGGEEPGRHSGDKPGRTGGDEPGGHGGVESGDAGSRVTGDAGREEPSRPSGDKPGRTGGEKPGGASGEKPGGASGEKPGGAGGEESGGALLEHALRGYADLHATRDVARVTSAMRRHGVAVPYPWRGGRRSGGLDLSAREHEIAVLAAKGRTNREIAADLFLSPRTVESHVSSVLRKLGCQSRSELAARLLPFDAAG